MGKKIDAFPADEWEIMMYDMYDCRSVLYCERRCEDWLAQLNDVNTEQGKAMTIIKETNSLDVIHRTAANELGMEDRVAMLDRWIADKDKPKSNDWLE